ncbi:MAG TPA: hypothetical protein GXX36_11410 [Clostridiaceae bacterium]|nr:hypothetical protein [Clostridiaceae bacterium]
MDAKMGNPFLRVRRFPFLFIVSCFIDRLMLKFNERILKLCISYDIAVKELIPDLGGKLNG